MFLPRRYMSVRSYLRGDPALEVCYPLSNYSGVDVSGKGKHGTLANTSPGQGKCGREGGLWCPAAGTSDNYVHTPLSTTIQEFTCGGWVHLLPLAGGGEPHVLWNKEQLNPTAYTKFPFFINVSRSPGGSISVSLDSGNDYSADHSLGWSGPLWERWLFYCFTRKNPDNALYIDQQLVATSSWYGTLSAGTGINYRIGSTTYYNVHRMMKGYIGEHFFLLRALTPGEVLAVYRASAGRYRNSMVLPQAVAPSAPTGVTASRGDSKNIVSWAWG